MAPGCNSYLTMTSSQWRRAAKGADLARNLTISKYQLPTHRTQYLGLSLGMLDTLSDLQSTHRDMPNYVNSNKKQVSQVFRRVGNLQPNTSDGRLVRDGEYNTSRKQLDGQSRSNLDRNISGQGFQTTRRSKDGTDLTLVDQATSRNEQSYLRGRFEQRGSGETVIPRREEIAPGGKSKVSKSQNAKNYAPQKTRNGTATSRQRSKKNMAISSKNGGAARPTFQQEHHEFHAVVKQIGEDTLEMTRE